MTQPAPPDTPAELDRHVHVAQAAYKDGYKDGLADAYRAQGYLVDEVDEYPRNNLTGFLAACAVLFIAIVFVKFVVDNTEPFPRKQAV